MLRQMPSGISIAFLISFLSISLSAEAAVCTNAGFGGTDISNRVDATNATTNSGCQVGNATTPHSPDPQTRANLDALFGYSDWTIIANPFASPFSRAGTYNIGASFFDIYDRGMLLFQSADPSDSLPSNYVGYLLLAANGTTGNWLSPFDDNDGCSYSICQNKVAYIKLLGHIKPTGGPSPSPVPLPAPVFLLAAAIASIGFLRSRRKRRTVVV